MAWTGNLPKRTQPPQSQEHPQVWEIIFFVGTVLLGIAMLYGIVQNSRRNKANDPITAEATKQLQKDPEGYEDHKRDELKAKLR